MCERERGCVRTYASFQPNCDPSFDQNQCKRERKYISHTTPKNRLLSHRALVNHQRIDVTDTGQLANNINEHVEDTHDGNSKLHDTSVPRQSIIGSAECLLSSHFTNSRPDDANNYGREGTGTRIAQNAEPR